MSDIKQWYIEVGRELDKNFHPKSEVVANLYEMFNTELYQYYLDGIEPFHVASIIGTKLELKRKFSAVN